MKVAAVLFCLFLADTCGLHLIAQSTYKEIDVKDGGTVTGTVRLVGDLPHAVQMDMTKDEKICGKRKPSPRLVVGKDNGVQNAVLCIEGITAGKQRGQAAPPVLGQRKCQYEPHVMLVPLGSPLEILNDDPILHNIHAYAGKDNGRTIFNIAQPVRGQRSTIAAKYLSDRGRVVATCDAGHPWMSAYIILTEHPYYAVTDAKGKYVLRDVPPGSYTLTMWHEGVAVANAIMENGKPKKYNFEEPYESRKEITVAPGGVITVDFDFVLRSATVSK
jgi:hypothetical protein